MFLFLSFEQVHFICVRLTYFQSLRACVSEVIQSIDDQLFKQEDLQKKKVPSVQFHVLQILGWLVFNWGVNAMCNSFTREHVAKYGSWHTAEFCQLLFFLFSMSSLSGICAKADSGGAVRRKDWKDPPLAKLQGSQLTGKQVGNYGFHQILLSNKKNQLYLMT